jgi:hypothetical protein
MDEEIKCRRCYLRIYEENKKSMQSKVTFLVYNSPFPFMLSKEPYHEIFGSMIVLQSKPVLKRKIVVN